MPVRIRGNGPKAQAKRRRKMSAALERQHRDLKVLASKYEAAKSEVASLRAQLKEAREALKSHARRIYDGSLCWCDQDPNEWSGAHEEQCDMSSLALAAHPETETPKGKHDE